MNSSASPPATTIDLVLKATGNVQLDKANGPEDSNMTEMLKDFLLIETVYEITQWCEAGLLEEGRCVGREVCPGL